MVVQSAGALFTRRCSVCGTLYDNQHTYCARHPHVRLAQLCEAADCVRHRRGTGIRCAVHSLDTIHWICGACGLLSVTTDGGLPAVRQCRCGGSLIPARASGATGPLPQEGVSVSIEPERDRRLCKWPSCQNRIIDGENLCKHHHPAAKLPIQHWDSPTRIASAVFDAWRETVQALDDLKRSFQAPSRGKNPTQARFKGLLDDPAPEPEAEWFEEPDIVGY